MAGLPKDEVFGMSGFLFPENYEESQKCGEASVHLVALSFQ
jgi:hypothetical protein